ncbi:OsmC family protein [Parasalinivibrio latis]|uniref:OsmC family protein n=1 Tax=Parasalinivibrio latis TaxID=2952610 RepID=UPI0030E243A0
MGNYTATVTWQRQPGEDFTDNKYSRGHIWAFDGGVELPASSSPQVVPLPYSVEANVDPEEAFVASLSSCHMLFFLSFAAKRGFVVESYVDSAVGFMEANEEGKIAMTKVILRPRVIFSGEKQPDFDMLEALHQRAHDACFIANSVKTDVVTEILND